MMFCFHHQLARVMDVIQISLIKLQRGKKKTIPITDLHKIVNLLHNLH